MWHWRNVGLGWQAGVQPHGLARLGAPMIDHLRELTLNQSSRLGCQGHDTTTRSYRSSPTVPCLGSWRAIVTPFRTLTSKEPKEEKVRTGSRRKMLVINVDIYLFPPLYFLVTSFHEMIRWRGRPAKRSCASGNLCWLRQRTLPTSAIFWSR